MPVKIANRLQFDEQDYKSRNIKTVGDLIKLSSTQVLKIHGVGPDMLKTIEGYLGAYGFKLQDR